MAREVVMPQLSDSMQEGTILHWLVEVGDEISTGDEFVEIEADKANVIYEAEWDGVLMELTAAEGDELEVGSPIARLGSREEYQSLSTDAEEEPGDDGSDGSTADEDAPPSEPDQAPAGDEVEAPVADEVESPEGEADGQRSGRPTPLARRLAASHGVELSEVEGTGIGGRIVKADVLALVPGAAPDPSRPGREDGFGESAETSRVQHPSASNLLSSAPAGQDAGTSDRGTARLVEPSKTQRTMAKRMTAAKGPVPHFYISTEVDMAACVGGRARLKEAAAEGEIIPTFNDMVVKASALALRELPQANAAFRDGRFEVYSRINIGVAVAAGDVLLVPTVFDADRRGLLEIAAITRELAQRAGDGKLSPAEMSGGTFTVSNLGMFGMQTVIPVINAGQAAILGVGEIAERAVVRDGDLTAAETMTLSLAGDHRVLTGADGARLLSRIREALQEPLGLAL